MLYVRDVNMEASEFEGLLDVALSGERPNDNRLPAHCGLPVMPSGGFVPRRPRPDPMVTVRR